MKKLLGRTLPVAILLSGALVMTPSYADKPEGKGDGKPGKSAKGAQKGGSHPGKGKAEQGDPRGGPGPDDRGDRRSSYFADNHRVVVRDYFDSSFRSGRCPPGLAKKNNGCMPPGQAKKWRVGQPLPRDVIFYDLPPQLVVSLGTPPAGHRFVRVASDILLIAVGTGMVLDAIEDLGAM